MVAILLAHLALLLPPLPTSVGGRTVADLYRKDDETVWVFEQDGKRIGYSEFRYAGALDLPGTSTHRFTSRVEIEMNEHLKPERPR